VDAWSIEENDLAVLVGVYSSDRFSRRLRRIGNDADFLADKGVQEARFSGIRPSGQRDVSDFQRDSGWELGFFGMLLFQFRQTLHEGFARFYGIYPGEQFFLKKDRRSLLAPSATGAFFHSRKIARVELLLVG
jgi:hypothetical protein